MTECIFGGNFAHFHVEFEACAAECKVITTQSRCGIDQSEGMREYCGRSSVCRGAFLQNEGEEVCISNRRSSIRWG